MASIFWVEKSEEMDVLRKPTEATISDPQGPQQGAPVLKKLRRLDTGKFSIQERISTTVFAIYLIAGYVMTVIDTG